MIVNEIHIDSVVFEGLEAVSNASGHKDCFAGVEFCGETLAVCCATRAEVTPRTVDAPRSDRDELVPGFCVEPASYTRLVVKRYVILYGTKIG